MTDFDMRCGKESAREYVKYAVTGNTLKKALPMVICASLLTSMIVVGIIFFIWMQSFIMLALSICAVLLGVGIFIFFRVTVNSTATKLMEAYSKHDGLVCSVSDQQIIVVRDNKPIRVIDWDKITEMAEGKTAFFLKEGEDGLIILDKSKVLSGTVTETSELIAKKSGAAK